ncbi:unnamed protein product [Prorocentrum cordatum]|uniref:Uncharacterized protein n=1 Tax=Prorocentrum cordatum TaxID=2364126 RepID=A0ABN9Q057_9DINO|nr:unnamed protein product [Polarella glacialis]
MAFGDPAASAASFYLQVLNEIAHAALGLNRGHHASAKTFFIRERLDPYITSRVREAVNGEFGELGELSTPHDGSLCLADSVPSILAEWDSLALDERRRYEHKAQEHDMKCQRQLAHQTDHQQQLASEAFSRCTRRRIGQSVV